MCLRCYGKEKRRKPVIKELGNGYGKLLINSLSSGNLDDRALESDSHSDAATSNGGCHFFSSVEAFGLACTCPD